MLMGKNLLLVDKMSKFLSNLLPASQLVLLHKH